LANHKHTVKAYRQDVVRRNRNRALRTRLRHALKSLRTAIDGGNTSDAQSAMSSTVSLIDRMSAKGVIHDNTAARYKSRLAIRLANVMAAAE